MLHYDHCAASYCATKWSGKEIWVQNDQSVYNTDSEHVQPPYSKVLNINQYKLSTSHSFLKVISHSKLDN